MEDTLNPEFDAGDIQPGDTVAVISEELHAIGVQGTFQVNRVEAGLILPISLNTDGGLVGFPVSAREVRKVEK